ncbi:ras guanyl-releasing protein 3-like [Dendronephthya gigantea]|uniref:ras guanyl-releasing protein 3-like n=1 Tax=Dendronephthya gigantea TaxID=151771 RepID=UPI00106A1407|nr:ras guanyl-releasing protein 3-like [Dendronephthya gigantea]
MDRALKSHPSVTSNTSLSKEFTSLSIESGSLEKLIKLALQEFDEDGCITSPPSVTIVLLTMHGWYVTSKDFLAKVIELYERQKGVNGVPLTNGDNVAEVFQTPHLNHDNQDSKKLTSIAETRESGDELDNEAGADKRYLTVPNGNGVALDASEDNFHETSDSNTGEYNTVTVYTSTENNNETSQMASTVAEPMFYSVAVVEPCSVDQIKETVETPEVKIRCIREESLDKQDESMIEDEQKEGTISQETSSSLNESHKSESEDDPAINVWIICQFLNYWLSKFGSYLRGDDSVLLDIAQFKKSLINEFPASEKKIKQLLGRSVLGAGELHSHSTRLVRQKEVARTKSLAFHDLTPKDIAEQLTHIDCRSLKKIPMSEWKTYARKTKLSTVPSLEKYVVRFNGLSRWIEAMVLQGASPEIRAHVIEKFLNVAECLRSHQNFNSLMAVIGALNHSALRRLHQTMLVLSENKKKFLQEMTEFLSSEGNYANYRRELASCSGFYVPILGVHLKDLIAVDCALPDYVSDKKLINFQKMVKFYTVIATLMNFKNMQPPAPSKFELINMLRLSIQMTITEDELYELSYAKEPKRSSVISQSDSSTNSQLFADWASGRVSSPDSKTIDRHVTSMVEAVFKFYDRDSDGRLTISDFEAISTNFPFIDAFGVVDADSDGVVTKEEMKSYFLKANYRALGRDFIHNFQETTYLTPSFCEHCGGVLWGLIRQGFKCKDCGINCHKACKGQVVIDCRAKISSPGSLNSNSSTLERAASKADAIRNKWNKKRRSRHPPSEHEPIIKEVPITVDQTDAVHSSPDHADQEIKSLKEENKGLKDENESLRNDLTQALEKVRNLESQLKLVRQETITFVLEQLDALQLRRNTAV